MFTVYLSVPLITPPVSVVPVIDGQQISLNISINVSLSEECMIRLNALSKHNLTLFAI